MTEPAPRRTATIYDLRSRRAHPAGRTRAPFAPFVVEARRRIRLAVTVLLTGIAR